MNIEKISQKLFILGHARSGTTIIADLLNSDDRVLLLYEAHMFESHWNPRFVSNFNLHHRQAAVFKAKGKFLPSRFDGKKPEAVLQELGAHYDFIGEKVAIGPLSGLASQAATAVLDYYLSYHLDASYILTFRAPLDSLFSLQKIFPQVSLAYLLQGWLLSFIELAAASHLLQQVMLLPVELTNMASWELIRTRLGIKGRADAHWFGSVPAKDKNIDATNELFQALAQTLGWPVEQVAGYMQRLADIYAQFLECIDPATLYYHPAVSFISQIGDKLLTEVHGMASQLSAAVGPGLPAAVYSWQKGQDIRTDRQTLPQPDADLSRMFEILRDRLFSSSGQVLLSDPESPYRLKTEGLQLQQEGEWLHLKAQPGREQHKHLTVQLPIDPLRIATFRFQLQREESSRFLMVQVGDDTGFYNTLIDTHELTVNAMAEVGPLRNLFSKAQLMPGGMVRISVSGMLTSGKGSYIRLYLCGENASIDFDSTDISMVIGDLVLGYLYNDCGLGG